ncbi:hypothetical protein C7293_13750 [filamentous cyanobacterium CCT1]|nr:hypothetical protein C7293_13750 [filamentous cyanobacterium CCT1]
MSNPVNLTEIGNQLRRAQAAGDTAAIERLKAQARPAPLPPSPLPPARPGQLRQFPEWSQLREPVYQALIAEYRQLEQQLKTTKAELALKSQVLYQAQRQLEQSNQEQADD